MNSQDVPQIYLRQLIEQAVSGGSFCEIQIDNISLTETEYGDSPFSQDGIQLCEHRHSPANFSYNLIIYHLNLLIRIFPSCFRPPVQQTSEPLLKSCCQWSAHLTRSPCISAGQSLLLPYLRLSPQLSEISDLSIYILHYWDILILLTLYIVNPLPWWHVGQERPLTWQ